MLFTEILDSLTECYNSMDIRTVAYRSENAWKSIITIIRFRIEDAEEIKKQHEKFKKYNLIWADRFRVGLYAFPIGEWKKLQANWEKNCIELQPDFLVNIPAEDLRRPVNDSPGLAMFDEMDTEWKSFAYDPRGSKEIYDQKILLDQNKFARENNFGNIYEYLSTILQVKVGYIIWQNSCNMIVAPVFFRINSAKLIDHTLTVQGVWHPDQSIKLAIQMYKKDRDGTRGSIKENIPIELKIEGKTTPLQEFTVVKQIEGGLDDEQFEIIVTSKGMLLEKYGGRVELSKIQKIELQDPLSQIFEKVVSMDILKKMITEFEPKKKKDRAIIFERGISWMLSLLGFNTILLGKGHERFKHNPDVVLDILAFSNDQVLLVNVTTGALEAPDITRLKHAKRELSRELHDFPIRPILVSSMSAQEIRSSVGENDVRLLGIEELENIIVFLEEGKKEEAREILFANMPRF